MERDFAGFWMLSLCSLQCSIVFVFVGGFGFVVVVFNLVVYLLYI